MLNNIKHIIRFNNSDKSDKQLRVEIPSFITNIISDGEKYTIVCRYYDVDKNALIYEVLPLKKPSEFVSAQNDTDEGRGYTIRTVNHGARKASYEIYEKLLNDGILYQIADLVVEEKKLQAVKAVKERYNVGLKEAKEFVDDLSMAIEVKTKI